MRFANYPLVPPLLGFILGDRLEDNFACAVNLTDGLAFMYKRPMMLTLLIIRLVLIFLPGYRRLYA